MIDATVSYRPSEDNNYLIDQISTNIQLALFKYDLYEAHRGIILEQVEKNPEKIKVVHLPLDSLRIPLKHIEKLIRDIYQRSECTNFVIHPNKGIEKFLNEFSFKDLNMTLCVETFAWRKKKVYRSPLEIIEACMIFKNTRMTIDTCHIEDIWFDHKILPYLLKFTNVIHLSNRAKGLGSHIPFNHPEGELKLVPFVRDLKYKYKWNGTIVLEYMKEHSHKLIKNLRYIESLLGD